MIFRFTFNMKRMNGKKYLQLHETVNMLFNWERLFLNVIVMQNLDMGYAKIPNEQLDKA